MKKTVVLGLLLALALCGCGGGEEAAGLRLWFPAQATAARPLVQAVDSCPFTPPQGARVGVEALTAALLAGPEGEGLANPFPPDARLLGWSVRDGLLTLDLSAPYGQLTGIDRTLAGCCLALTLCQLEGVERVAVQVEGEWPPGWEERTFTPEELLFTGAEEEPRQISAELYFPRALGKGLGFESRELTLTEDDGLYLMIAQALLEGPQDPDLHTLLPDGVLLLGAWVDDGICFVNFSAAFLELAPQEEAEQNLLLYCVVDTMGNLSTVSAVQLLVEGERVPQFGGQETLLPLEPDFGLLSGG